MPFAALKRHAAHALLQFSTPLLGGPRVRHVGDSTLWLGHAGDARDLRGLLSAGIAAVVDLAIEERPIALARDLVYCRFPMIDGEGNPPWLILAAIEAVAGLMRSGVTTLVACSAGMSRTPVIAGAAVARVRGRPLAEGLRAVSLSGPIDLSPGLLREVRASLA